MHLFDSFRRCVLALVAAMTVASTSAEQTITVLTTIQPPYTNLMDDKPTGMFVDVLNEAGKSIGLTFSYQFMPWSRTQSQAKQGDVLIIPLARSPEREPFYQWIVPVLQFDTVIFTLREPPASIAEARNLSIGLMFNTTFEKEVALANLTNLQRVPDELTIAKKLHAGRIDGWITTDRMAPGAYREAGFNPDELKRGPKLGPTKVLYIAASPDFSPQVAQRIADAVAKLKKEGRLDAIVERYR